MSKPKQKAKAASKRRHQYAALPVRFTGEGEMQVLLLTSRQTHRWVIPKGWPIRKLTPAATAAREAYEEAGLEGVIESEKAIAHYHYEKGLDDGSTVRVKVLVFLMRVARQRETWPEQAERETRWFDPEAAAGLVEELELAAILLEARSLVSLVR